MSVTYLRCYKC